MNNKNIIITLIIVLSFFAIGLTSVMIMVIKNSSDFNFVFSLRGSKAKLVESSEYDTDMIDGIKITTYSTDIEIRESSDKIKIQYYSSSRKNPKIMMENRIVTIDEKEDEVSCVGICDTNRKVVIYLPTSYAGLLDIVTKSGDIDSRTLLKNTNINTTSGDIELKEVSNVNIKTTSGDVEIYAVENFINVKTTSGDIEIQNFDIKENSILESVSGDIEISNNLSNCYVDTHTLTGDIHINKSDRRNELEVRIKTTSGDIDVN